MNKLINENILNCKIIKKINIIIIILNRKNKLLKIIFSKIIKFIKSFYQNKTLRISFNINVY